MASYPEQTDMLARWHRHPHARLSYAVVIRHLILFFGCKCTDFSKNHKARSRFFLKKIQEPHKTSKIAARGDCHRRTRKPTSPHAEIAIAAREKCPRPFPLLWRGQGRPTASLPAEWDSHRSVNCKSPNFHNNSHHSRNNPSSRASNNYCCLHFDVPSYSILPH